MVGLIQVVIYFLFAYLIFKGVEIFQMAYVSPTNEETRKKGMNTGIFMIILAFIVGGFLVFLAENIAVSVSNTLNSLPKL